MVVMDRLSAYETGLLADLSGDVGVSLWEWDGLFERCDRCGRYFVARVLRIHILDCRGRVVLYTLGADKILNTLLGSHIGDWGH
jgi:hypothetical protein